MSAKATWKILLVFGQKGILRLRKSEKKPGDKLVLCDTNVMIELLKGNEKVLEILKKIGFNNICISSITSMEIYYGALNNKELKELIVNLTSVKTIHLNPGISQRSIELIIKYAASHNLEIPDALIAATAIFYNYKLFTYNLKDFKYIEDLTLYS